VPEVKDSKSFDGILDGYTEVEKYKIPKEDEKLVARLKTELDYALDYKRAFERDIELYRLYLTGQQMVLRNRDTGEIVRLSMEDSKRLRSQNNVLRPISRAFIGKVAKMIPTWRVIPATDDFAEQEGARVAEALLQFKRREQKLDKKYLDVCNFLPWAGNAFIELEWDIQAGKRVAFCGQCNYFEYNLQYLGQPCPQCSMQMQQQAQQGQGAPPQGAPQGPEQQQEQPPMGPPMQEAHEGDAVCTVRDPRDVFLPSGCIELEAASWVCVREAMEVSRARQKFPQFAPFIHKDGSIFSDKSTQWRYSVYDSYGSSEWLRDHVWVYKFYERPTELYPKGRAIKVVNDMVVEEIESPYYCLGRPPLYHFGGDKNDGEFWREPWIANAWHRQRELNINETQKREHVELVQKPKLLVGLGAQVSTDEITAQSAQVIHYNQASGKPEWLRPPDLPQFVAQRGQELIADIQMMASVTAQENGQESADPNGRAMAIVNAEADQQIGPIVNRLHDEWRELGRGLLILCQEGYHPQRVITVVGPEGLQSYGFEELNLQPGWDIDVEESDGLSRNPAIRMNEVMQLAQVGNGAFFMNPQTGAFDTKAFARMAKLNLPMQDFDTEATEGAVASAIPYLMAQGYTHQPMPEDDPMVFSRKLLGWLRGPGRKADPSLSGAVRQVWMYYQSMAMQQQPQPGQLPQGPSAPGSDVTAPGGTMNNPGMLGTNLAPSVGDEAGQSVANADSTGDNLAKGITHES
jgi:hypothetical protein